MKYKLRILKDISEKINEYLDEVEPYKCKICKKWKKTQSKAKGICKQCYEKME